MGTWRNRARWNEWSGVIGVECIVWSDLEWGGGDGVRITNHVLGKWYYLLHREREWVLTFLMIRPCIYCSDRVGFKPSHDKTDRLGPCICCSEGCGPLIVLNEKTIHVMMSWYYPNTSLLVVCEHLVWCDVEIEAWLPTSLEFVSCFLSCFLSSGPLWHFDMEMIWNDVGAQVKWCPICPIIPSLCLSPGDDRLCLSKKEWGRRCGNANTQLAPWTHDPRPKVGYAQHPMQRFIQL